MLNESLQACLGRGRLLQLQIPLGLLVHGAGILSPRGHGLKGGRETGGV
jgi:hypothetical protein